MSKMSEWRPIDTENDGYYWMRYHVISDGQPAIYWTAEIVLIRDGEVHRMGWSALDTPDYVGAEVFGIKFPNENHSH